MNEYRKNENILFGTGKKIVIVVTNDLFTDNRVHKVANSLHSFGFEIQLIGIKKPKIEYKDKFKTSRFSLFFKKGILFYAEYNIRLFFKLFFVKYNVILSNDLDTLLASYLSAKLHLKQIVYDSHELFTEVPELANRKFKQRVWFSLQSCVLSKIQYSYTVCKSLARLYSSMYKINMRVVRNIPIENIQTNNYEMPENDKRKIILYQGALNVGRGLEHLIDSMKFADENFVLYIAGTGDLEKELRNRVKEAKLENKIVFTGRLPYPTLLGLTSKAFIGLSIEENTGKNYYYALPNKLFDYIRCGVPVLCSEFPEMSAIIKKYEIGTFIKNHKPEHIAEKLNSILQNKSQYEVWKKNLISASGDLKWEKEEQVLKEIFFEFCEKLKQ